MPTSPGLELISLRKGLCKGTYTPSFLQAQNLALQQHP